LALLLPKATGKLDLRVREVGPERFGIVSVDCAKERSVWMLRDFYGRVLVEPSTVEHTGPGLRAMTAALRGAVQKHELGHVVVAIERTGNYHRPVQRACRSAGFETRIVHPFASQHFREIDHPDDKTDEHDPSDSTNSLQRRPSSCRTNACAPPGVSMLTMERPAECLFFTQATTRSRLQRVRGVMYWRGLMPAARRAFAQLYGINLAAVACRYGYRRSMFCGRRSTPSAASF
jgi:hypothetical protein